MGLEIRKQLAEEYKDNPNKHPEYKIYYDEFYSEKKKAEVKKNDRRK